MTQAPAPIPEAKWLAHVAKPVKILFLDDDSKLCELMSIVCSQHHVELTCANSIKEAIEKAVQNSSDPFDAMILDVRLSNGTGMDFYKYVMQQWPRTHVVFLTGYDSAEVRQKIEAIGPARVHAKCNVMVQNFLAALFAQWGVPPITA